MISTFSTHALLPLFQTIIKQKITPYFQQIPVLTMGYTSVPFLGFPMIGHSILDSDQPVAAVITAAFFLIIYVIWLYIFIAPDRDTSSKKEVSNNALGAWVICQGFVEKRLTSPSTADYPWDYRDKVEVVGTNTYLVTSYVDSQNALGAVVRSTFSCKVKQNGDSWELITLAVR